jgi:hypothetical protein
LAVLLIDPASRSACVTMLGYRCIQAMRPW